MANPDFSFSLNGGALQNVNGGPGVKLPADNKSSATIVCAGTKGASLAGYGFEVGTCGPQKVTVLSNGQSVPIEGTVDSSGLLNVVIGPSPIGIKGDNTVSVTIGNRTHSFNTRFI